MASGFKPTADAAVYNKWILQIILYQIGHPVLCLNSIRLCRCLLALAADWSNIFAQPASKITVKKKKIMLHFMRVRKRIGTQD